MSKAELGPDHSLAMQIKDLRDAVAKLSTRDILQNASIGSGGLSVTGAGGIKITGGGSLTVTGGDVFVPTAHAAVSGYTAAYINSDGRLSMGASAVKFKQDFEPVEPEPLVAAIFAVPMVRYRLIEAVEELGADKAEWLLGTIADYLDTTALREQVYRVDGEPLSIQHEQLIYPAILAIQNLDARLKALGA